MRLTVLGPEVLERVEWDLEVGLDSSASVAKGGQEFTGYIQANRPFLVNYGDRYRNGERISTGFVGSTVNEVSSKRIVKTQQMRWTKAGAHRLLQVRVQVLDEDLRRTFARWYPGIERRERPREQPCAA